jgi:hypothetical protein
MSLFFEQPCETHRRAQFQHFRTHPLRECDRVAEVGPSRFGLANFLPQFPAYPQNLGLG